MKFIIQTRTPAPQEKAHLQSAIPAAKPKTAKELFLSISLPSLKKNKFPTPTPAYFQTESIGSTAYNMVFAKDGVKHKVGSSVVFRRKKTFRSTYF